SLSCDSFIIISHLFTIVKSNSLQVFTGFLAELHKKATSKIEFDTCQWQALSYSHGNILQFPIAQHSNPEFLRPKELHLYGHKVKEFPALCFYQFSGKFMDIHFCAVWI
ncbi:hypothetical protein, partial [Ruminococcus sp.]|uniref:hypothetical protein n=1 Tax=Ruminococcus sp. TaxID=41978 RepID=UPI0025F846A7